MNGRSAANGMVNGRSAANGIVNGRLGSPCGGEGKAGGAVLAVFKKFTNQVNGTCKLRQSSRWRA